MTERRKLSLGNVSERERTGADRTGTDPKRAWKVSPNRAAALKQRAREMRRDPTEAQQALWEHLKDKQLGFAFNREVVMGSAIVDFACKSHWLVIETGGVDGAAATIAELSDRKLIEVGVRVLRFAETEVLEDIERITRMIKDELEKPFERPRNERTNAPNH